MATERNGSSLSLSLAALGVVFGDIGTSPLYALRACFSDVAGVSVDEPSVLGVLSLIFWSLALVITVKYVGSILRADNKGEGGVLALTTLVLRESPGRRGAAITVLGLIGCAFFYGDGVITPAVTVLGAVEGLEIIAPGLARMVLPVTMLVLVWLFAIQRRGTGAIGRLFGPVMLVWFGVLAAMGLVEIAGHSRVLAALNPLWALEFFAAHGVVAFTVFGAVFLAVTGGEALYADLGHFGRAPIARAWYAVVWPALVLNYFGQGALLLEDPSALRNPFYLLAPEAALVPLVVLATMASVIASQAVISGVFAIAQQCQQLGFVPRMRTIHSSAEVIGQVYVPVMNWLVCAATLGLSVGFGSSSAVANAYGVGVSCTMLIDSVLMILLLSTQAGASARARAALLVGMLFVDAAFVLANAQKIPGGGWFPLLFGLLAFGLMRTWEAGRAAVAESIRVEEHSVQWFLDLIAGSEPRRVPGVAVFLSSSATGVPRTLVRNFRLNGVLHEHTVLLTVTTERVPRVLRGARAHVEHLAPGLDRVIIHTGFMEVPDVPKLLRDAEHSGLDVRTDDAVYFIGSDDVVVFKRRGLPHWRKRVFQFLQRNSQVAAATFRIPPGRTMEIGGQVVI